jgi:chromosome segregation protein
LELAVDAENNLQERITNTDSELTGIKENIVAESRRLDAKQNEYNLTKSLVDNLEGFPESIRFLKKNSDWAKNAPLFSDVLFCREEYRIAIENYLEPMMNHYVVENYEDAISAINLLSKSSRGRAQFFILSNYPADTPVPDAQNGLLPALNVVEVDNRYKPLVGHLLKNVYLVDDKADNGLDAHTLPDGVVLLGKSGKFNKAKLTMAGGSVGLFEGKRIGRAKNLENLAKEIKQLESQLTKLKADRRNCRVP